MDGVRKDDLRYVDHCDSALNSFETKDGQEVDASIWRMIPFEEICDLSLTDQHQQARKNFKEIDFSTTMQHCPRLMNSKEKMLWSSRGGR